MKQEVKQPKVVADHQSFNKGKKIDASKSASSLEKSFKGNDGK